MSNYGLHVIKNPAGTYSFVGSIPIELGSKVKPTCSDIMAGRTVSESGQSFAIKFPVFDTSADAVEYAKNKGFVAKT